MMNHRRLFIALLIISISVVLGGCLTNIERTTEETLDPADINVSEVEDINTTGIEERTLEKINAERIDRDEDRLEHSSRLRYTARLYSQDMVERNFTGHEDPDGDYPIDRLEEAGITDCEAWGENLAYLRYSDIKNESEEAIAQRIYDEWMHSDAHRELMLNGTYDTGGVGVYITKEGKVLATLHVCQPY